jgi:hypothetical protein
MQATAERGSEKLLEKLFERGTTEEELLNLIGNRGTKSAMGLNMVVKNIWWYGQPAIDQIIAKVHVGPDQLGNTVESLIKAQTEHLRVKAEIFPLGIPRPDLAELQITLHRNLTH